MSEKAERTREKILDTAIKHFLRDGFSGASLRSIVKDAGLTTGAFYKYYPTKEMLFDALIDPYIEHIYEIYDGILADFEKLSAFFACLIASFIHFTSSIFISSSYILIIHEI